MEIISSGRRYGLADANPTTGETVPNQEIVFSEDGSEGTTVQEVLEVLVIKVQLVQRTTGMNQMSLLHLRMALETLEAGY